MSSITNLISVGVNGTGTANSVMKWLDADTATDSIITDNGSTISIGGSLAVDTNTLFVDAVNNRVGIGTSSPTTKLHIGAGTTIPGGMTSQAVIVSDTQTGGSAETILSIVQLGDSISSAVGLVAGIISAANPYFAIKTRPGGGGDAVERMRIDSSGNVGIGTSSPNYPLHIASTSGGILKLQSLDNTTGGVFMTFMDSADTEKGFLGYGSNNNDDFYIYNGESANTTFWTNAAERMRITSGGELYLNLSGVTSADISNGGFAFRNNIGKYLQIGTGLTDDQPIMLFYKSNGAGSAVFTGSITTVGSSTAYNTSSDYRLKENVVPMEGALDRVSQLQPARFNFIADPEKTVDGFLAHQVQEVVPEAVTGVKDGMREEEYEVEPAVYEEIVHPAQEAILDEEGNVIQEAKEEWTEKVLVSEAVMGTRLVPDYQGIDQSKLVPVLVGAIQELRAEIELLKNK